MAPPSTLPGMSGDCESYSVNVNVCTLFLCKGVMMVMIPDCVASFAFN